MAAKAIPNLQRMSLQERAVWYRNQLLQLRGSVRKEDGKRWHVLEHQESLPQLMSELSEGQLTKANCTDVNKVFAKQDWRRSWPVAGGKSRFAHGILIPDDTPESTGSAGDAAPSPQGDVAPSELAAAGQLLTWAAGEVPRLRVENERLAEENERLRARLEGLEAAAVSRQQLGQAAVKLFHDGLAEAAKLRED
jgi:hypothetical protein